MNIILYLFEKFISQQKLNILAVFIFSLVLSFLYTNLSSMITANLVASVHKNAYMDLLLNYKYFIAISVLYLVIYYFYKIIQNYLLTVLTHWTKSEIFQFILKSNNENMRNMNFVEFITPIARISSSCAMLLNDIITNIVPTVGVLIVISMYFFYTDIPLATGFLIGNVLIWVYLAYFWKDMFLYKQKQEHKTVENEKYIMDAFTNIDKIIYRGEVKHESEIFEKKTDECIGMTVELMKYITDHTFVMNGFVFIILLGSLRYIITLHHSKKISVFTFITILTMLLMYRDNLLGTIQNIPYNIETVGRVDLMIHKFNDMFEKSMDMDEVNSRIHRVYKTHDLSFDKIAFRNVSFKYSGMDADSYVFKNYNQEVHLSNKIIGITGTSGKGKSSFVKLLIRLHRPNEGSIWIDDVDLTTIDPYYIRKNITYVNQSSRLFDRKIIENIYYGCQDTEKCNESLRDILSYKKIQYLYRNMDIDKASAGPLGENLSGGQRQVTNIISGLINPTKILILDEPTNGLDAELKSEVLQMLKNFKKHKKTIMIITHDRDVSHLFDETIEI
jgi:ATP-binding cassette, subfamily B, bacterial HlyB/CyaB